MGLAQTGRTLTAIVDRTAFAERWECAGVCHKVQEGAKGSGDNNSSCYFT